MKLEEYETQEIENAKNLAYLTGALEATLKRRLSKKDAEKLEKAIDACFNKGFEK